jgi:hypothetical protein
MVRLLLTVLLNGIILILVAVFIYVGIMLYSAYKDDKETVSQLIDPRLFIQRFFNKKEVWKVYESKNFSFEYPNDWRPKIATLEGDGGEVIDLNIPVIFSITKIGSRNLIGYTVQPIEKIRPQNLESETEFIMLNRKGYKWVYKRDKMIIYQYAVSLDTDHAVFGQRLSFYISVESVKSDEALEKKLDRVASSVKERVDEN